MPVNRQFSYTVYGMGQIDLSAQYWHLTTWLAWYFANDNALFATDLRHCNNLTWIKEMQGNIVDSWQWYYRIETENKWNRRPRAWLLTGTGIDSVSWVKFSFLLYNYTSGSFQHKSSKANVLRSGPRNCLWDVCLLFVEGDPKNWHHFCTPYITLPKFIIKHFLLSLIVKRFWKSVNIW